MVNSPARAFTRGNTSLVRVVVQEEDTRGVGRVRSSTRIIILVAVLDRGYCKSGEGNVGKCTIQAGVKKHCQIIAKDIGSPVI